MPKPTVECDLLLIPLATFWKMHRIGYGGGYYDRYLSSRTEVLRCGIAFEAQKLPFVPRFWDEPLDLIVTERFIYANGSPESRKRIQNYFGNAEIGQTWIWTEE